MRFKLQFYFLGNVFFSLLYELLDEKTDTTHISVCSIWNYSHEVVKIAHHKDFKTIQTTTIMF